MSSAAAIAARTRRIAKIIPRHTAFFCCDIQERFRLVVHGYPSVIHTAEKMLKAAKILDIPVIATEQYPKFLPPPENDGSEGPQTALVPLAETSPLPPLLDLEVPTLRPHWVPLAKTAFSMIVPEIDQQIKEWDTRSVVLFGIESHVCVLQTAFDLLERDIDVHVLADGISSVNGDEVGLAIKRMRDAGAHITTSESVLFQILQDANDPRFRALAGLVTEYKKDTKQALEFLIAGRAL
ncbi:hypothetical protein JCM11641_000037 [Rhodosporidiobolus odoratus]